jgi:hypothetical protein
MPLELEDQGYLELGLPLDADVRHLPEVLAVRIQVYAALKKWELMQTVAKRTALYDPDKPQWTASWAYATRRARANLYPLLRALIFMRQCQRLN